MIEKGGITHLKLSLLRISVQFASHLIFSITIFGSKIMYVDIWWPDPTPCVNSFVSLIPIQFTVGKKVGTNGIQKHLNTITLCFLEVFCANTIHEMRSLDYSQSNCICIKDICAILFVPL